MLKIELNNYIVRKLTMPSKYNLVLCVLHYTPLHGKTINSNINIENHFIIDTIFTDIDLIAILKVAKNLSKMYKKQYLSNKISHNSVRNYFNIVSNKNYIIPEIAEYIILPTQEMIAIKKTFWIKIIQRTWKKIFQKRCKIFKDPLFIIKYQLCKVSSRDIPSIRGMLFKI